MVESVARAVVELVSGGGVEVSLFSGENVEVKLLGGRGSTRQSTSSCTSQLCKT